ncbi:type I-E CRISPR-associated protein Cse1/CasA [Tepidimonas taiwanensis]|uniref:type I-E CRISPR-associated protein Cse1/CasA n=1 Tax=Tepidimonas taiwanensis TaxID=307486 RepID=UPI001CC8F9FB|nr:type I-E CRISPR-associated protein Cse1/CasA [Tepidimonas taiwanensis]UBQ04584.1 type I-E CRISPR-associated protein Cse1/CasA [Tepidimonas taiwanensis]
MDWRETMHDLLHDPLIGVRTRAGERRLSLPDLLAALSAGEVEGYTGLRAHQADPWHVFLVQLAASIQARQPTDTLPPDPAYWREGLLDLAGGKASAWHLLVEDVTQPAFMQHPWMSWEAEAADYGVTIKRGQTSYAPKATTPDELDVLVTSKNHDVKMARVGAEEVEAWLYALVLLQTTSGFLGQGNYGIVRMNGGFASRPVVAWAVSLHPSQRFQHEVAVVMQLRNSTVRTYGYAARGVTLTWVRPWSRSDHQFQLADLEPWFVEAARPIRLVRSPSGHLIALGATSKARQIGPKTLENGDVGDPWIPINTADKKKGRSAMTLSADGFTPERLTDLLFAQGFELTALQQPQVSEGPGWFVASCLVRGQGTTEGYHEVRIPVPPKARLALLHTGQRQTLGQLAQRLLSDAKAVQKALNTALAVLSEGGPDQADFERVESWLKTAKRDFGRRWESLYFPTLWRGAEEEHDTVRRDWQQRLVDEAHALLDEATQRLPLPANRTWRAITQAERAFHGLLRKHELPFPRRAPAHTLETMEDAIP